MSISHTSKGRELGLRSLEKRRLRGWGHVSYQCIEILWARLFKVVPCDMTKGTYWNARGSLWTPGNMVLLRGWLTRRAVKPASLEIFKAAWTWSWPAELPLGGPAWAPGWTRCPPEVPSNANHSTSMLIKKNTDIFKFPGRIWYKYLSVFSPQVLDETIVLLIVLKKY